MCLIHPFATCFLTDQSCNAADSNLQKIVPFTTAGAPLSRPGCWAWLGNLQVGRIMDTHNASILDLPWNRAHFGAYSIVSSPLVLDLGALEQLEPVIPIITNPHALAVNQQWAGSPGRLLISIDPDSPNGQPDAAGFIKLVGALGPGHDMRSSNTSTLAEAVSTRILGRRTAPFPHLSLFLTRAPHGFNPRS